MRFFSLGKSKRDYKEREKERRCGRCTKKFDSNYVDCPRCFRLECQDCLLLHDWMHEYPKDANNPEKNGTCPRCCCVYNDFVTVSRFINGILVPCQPYNSMDEWQAEWAERNFK